MDEGSIAPSPAPPKLVAGPEASRMSELPVEPAINLRTLPMTTYVAAVVIAGCLLGGTVIGIAASRLPDLRVSDLQNLPAAARPGNPLPVTITVSNTGKSTASASTARFYLRRVPTLTSDRILLAGDQPIPGLAPNESTVANASLLVPSTVPAGEYVLIACADDLQVVVESNRNNNCITSRATIAISPP